MTLVFHIFIVVAVMVYLVAVIFCGHHGIGPILGPATDSMSAANQLPKAHVRRTIKSTDFSVG